MKVTRIGPAVDPLPVFAQAATKPFPFLLESAARSQRFARYSFVGTDPYAVLVCRPGSARIYREGRIVEDTSDPFSLLERMILERSETSDLPLAGAAVGYLGYDLRYRIEKLPDTNRRDIDFPDLFFAFYDTVYVIDHQADKTYRVQLSDSPPRAMSYGAHLKEFGNPVRRVGMAQSAAQSNVSRENYLAAVRRAQEYIRAGDIYQVNLSQRFHATTSLSCHEMYEKIRTGSPAMYAALLQFGSRAVLSSSPEEFLSIESRRIRTRPVKGTRRRGTSPEEDRSLKDELLHSAKDDSELAMIVDLERNDLGRVCEMGSVRVVEPKVLEEHATVFHLSATVEGNLREDAGLADVLRATFPGGSITGAPKIRAMQIIEELEPTKRGVYTGAIGYFGFNGRTSLSMAIRILLSSEKDLYFQVGGAITSDSDPEAEYDETLAKAEGIRRALEIEIS